MWTALLLNSLECARKEHFLHGQGCTDKHIKQFSQVNMQAAMIVKTAEVLYLAGAGGAMMF